MVQSPPLQRGVKTTAGNQAIQPACKWQNKCGLIYAAIYYRPQSSGPDLHRARLQCGWLENGSFPACRNYCFPTEPTLRCPRLVHYRRSTSIPRRSGAIHEHRQPVKKHKPPVLLPKIFSPPRERSHVTEPTLMIWFNDPLVISLATVTLFVTVSCCKWSPTCDEIYPGSRYVVVHKDKRSAIVRRHGTTLWHDAMK